VPWRDLSSSQLIDRIPLAVLVTRLDGRIEYANPQANALLEARTRRALHGRDVTEFRWGADFRRVLAGSATRKTGFAQWQDEARYRGSRGKEVWVLETMIPVHNAGGEIGCFIHFLQELTGG
jgi:PAS domain S-box-containing protein